MVVSDTAVVAAENAGTATYTVKLATQSTASVTVTPTSDTATAATVSGALTFTTGNRNTAQTAQAAKRPASGYEKPGTTSPPSSDSASVSVATGWPGR